MSQIVFDPLLKEAAALFNEFKETRKALLLDARLTDFHEQIRNLIVAQNWSELKNFTLPEPLSINRDRVCETATKLRKLVAANEQQIARALTAKALALRIAVKLHRAQLQTKNVSFKSDSIYQNAIASNRFLTTTEMQQLKQRAVIAQRQSTAEKELLEKITSPAIKDQVLVALAALRLRQAHAELNNGLLLTEQMSQIIAETLPAIKRGEPLLLIGETGGAKTALAEFLAKRINNSDLNNSGHEFISGYGDISSTQVIGAHELRVTDGATVSAFVPGPLLRAMSSGTPIILDEINAMPPEFLKRLNRILQLLPGDEYRVQENAGRPVRVASGFVILATANEQASERYRGTFSLSSELINRFGANTFRVHYPDAELEFGDDPQENLLLASIALSNSLGEFPVTIETHDIERVARFAFITQQIFSGRYGAGFDEFISNDQRIDGRPGLEESVLAPRTLVKLLQNVRDSGGMISIEHALNRFVDGVLNPTDRVVLSQIMKSQGFTR